MNSIAYFMHLKVCTFAPSNLNAKIFKNPGFNGT